MAKKSKRTSNSYSNRTAPAAAPAVTPGLQRETSISAFLWMLMSQARPKQESGTSQSLVIQEKSDVASRPIGIIGQRKELAWLADLSSWLPEEKFGRLFRCALPTPYVFPPPIH